MLNRLQFSTMAVLKTLILGLTIMVSVTIIGESKSLDNESSLELMMTDDIEWPLMSAFDEDLDDEDGVDAEESSEYGRRSLFWRRMKYYISYGALAANRIPCPPRSGRSYYTHNCYKARGAVHPYTRGCSVITRCRR